MGRSSEKTVEVLKRLDLILREAPPVTQETVKQMETRRQHRKHPEKG